MISITDIVNSSWSFLNHITPDSWIIIWGTSCFSRYSRLKVSQCWRRSIYAYALSHLISLGFISIRKILLGLCSADTNTVWLYVGTNDESRPNFGALGRGFWPLSDERSLPGPGIWGQAAGWSGGRDASLLSFQWLTAQVNETRFYWHHPAITKWGKDGIIFGLPGNIQRFSSWGIYKVLTRG